MMQKSERWGPVGVGNGNPSARLRAARSMPQWMETRGGLPTPPPPPPPLPEPEPSPNDPEYEVIDVPGQNYSNTLPTTIEVRVKRCELCGASGPSVLCEQCPQQSFCPSCDEMYHRHPKRQSHVRRAIMDTSRLGEPPRPPLPPKGEGLTSPAPVPPPRRNKKNQLPPSNSSTLKRDTSIVGSIKRIITGGKLPPPRPPSLSRDRSASLMNNNMDFTRNQMMMPDMDPNNWARGGRVGSMTAINMAPGFGPMMHAQSMAHLGCPSCWGWGSQAALHQAGMHGPHSPHPMPPGMMPPPQPYWYPSWDPRRHRRHHHGRLPAESSSEEDEHLSPALSRRSMRGLDSDSDESFKKFRPQSRRESLADLRRRDDDSMSLRGGRYDDDTRSLRGHRRDSLRRREDTTVDREVRRTRRFDDVLSERGSITRRVEDIVSERGNVRRRQEDMMTDDRRHRRRDDETFSDRGGRRLSDTKYRDDDSWERSSRKSDKSDKKYQPESTWDKHTDNRKERYVIDSDSDKMPKPIIDKKQDRLQEPLKGKDDRRTGSILNKSSETISSLVSSTSGEDKAKGSKKDRVFSDTGQRRRTTLDSNHVQTEVKEEIIPEVKEIEETKEPEEDMKPVGSVPTTEWECQHCTYVNPPGIRVCEVCCKTKTVDGMSPDMDEDSLENKVADLQITPEIKIQETKPVNPKPEAPKVQEQPKKEPLVETSNGAQTTKNISHTSKGTSPPPQSISTQTYDVAGLGLKKTSSDVGWSSPRRSFSRQSIISDTAQSGISPPRSRSPGETDSQATESRQPRRTDLTSTLIRKPSKAISLANDQNNTMVQKQVDQGLEMVKLLREAEEVGFSGEEVSVAVEHCGDGSPLQWLLENWTHMIDTVVTLATNYGHERKENTIGTVSEREARAALIMHQGSVWSAVTEVVQQRQNKYGELLSRGNFSREDIVTALTAHHGDLEAAYMELTKGEPEEPRLELDPSGRVQSWLTQHVYQSLPKLKQTLTKQQPQPRSQTQASRRHSDVHRFLDEILSAQASPPIFVDNRYASLHNLASKATRGQMGGDFGAPPERYSSCLNLHEASIRTDLTAPRLYNTQQPKPFYPSKTMDDAKFTRRVERRISVPDHLQEFKERFFFDRQVSAPDDYRLFERLEPSMRQTANKWKNLEITNDLSNVLRSDSQTDGRSTTEYYEDSKSEDVVKDDEEEEEDAKEARDQVYNGRLQLLIQRNHKRKRRSKKPIKSYHSKYNIKSDVKREAKSNREELPSKGNQINIKKDENKTNNHGVTPVARLKKDSTDEYESIESSEEESLENKALTQDNTVIRKQAPKNERVIVIEREPDTVEQQITIIEKTELEETKTLDVPSDKDSVSKSHSDEIREADYKEQDGSFSNSIPFIDEDEVFSDASEEVLTKPHTSVSHFENHSTNKGGSRSDDSSKYQYLNNKLENQAEMAEVEQKPTLTELVDTKTINNSKNKVDSDVKEQSEEPNVKEPSQIVEPLVSNKEPPIIILTKDTDNVTDLTNDTDIEDEEHEPEELYEEVSEEEEYEFVEVEQSLDSSSVDNNLIIISDVIASVAKDDTNTENVKEKLPYTIPEVHPIEEAHKENVITHIDETDIVKKLAETVKLAAERVMKNHEEIKQCVMQNKPETLSTVDMKNNDQSLAEASLLDKGSQQEDLSKSLEIKSEVNKPADVNEESVAKVEHKKKSTKPAKKSDKINDNSKPINQEVNESKHQKTVNEPPKTEKPKTEKTINGSSKPKNMKASNESVKTTNQKTINESTKSSSQKTNGSTSHQTVNESAISTNQKTFNGSTTSKIQKTLNDSAKTINQKSTNESTKTTTQKINGSTNQKTPNDSALSTNQKTINGSTIVKTQKALIESLKTTNQKTINESAKLKKNQKSINETTKSTKQKVNESVKTSKQESTKEQEKSLNMKVVNESTNQKTMHEPGKSSIQKTTIESSNQETTKEQDKPLNMKVVNESTNQKSMHEPGKSSIQKTTIESSNQETTKETGKSLNMKEINESTNQITKHELGKSTIQKTTIESSNHEIITDSGEKEVNTSNGIEPEIERFIQSEEGNTAVEGIEAIHNKTNQSNEVQISEDKEKGSSNELSNDKAQTHSDDGSSDDFSRLTAFASGNLKTKIKVDTNRLSPVADIDESSDRDVSPIPTDSEGDKSRSPIKSKRDDDKNMTTNNREEMVTLIKESLSKDVVLDRLVGTILGAIQSGGASNILKEQDLALLLSEGTKGITEVPVTVADDGMVSAIQLVQGINVNPKEALQETILHCETIKRATDVIKDDIQLKNEEFQREVRKVLAEGLVKSYPQAELLVNLIELKFNAEEAVQAATECSSLPAAISFLHQECPLCANKCTIKKMVGMLECDHRCCKDCAYNYFNIQVTEGSVWDCTCPFCRLPDLRASTQDQAQLYFSHLDILLKGILSETAHELFQRKLRDWTLAQDPNFKWCTKCSSGFIANPNQKILMCPDCRSITCARCRQPWEGGHEASCEEAAQQAEPEKLLNKHLEEEGITCPSCKVRYSLARGGCMHMTCSTCKYEFCSGCSKPFLMGDRCQVSEYCAKLGLHAHHPRNCLFYLRDKEPQNLEQLLKEHNVDFKRDEKDEGNTGRCKVSLFKETDDGMIEAECNHPIYAEALCRTHYVEHLVKLVKVRKLDPATIMDLTEAQQELRRRGKMLPDRLPRQCERSYLLALIKIVQEEIPLE